MPDFKKINDELNHWEKGFWGNISNTNAFSIGAITGVLDVSCNHWLINATLLAHNKKLVSSVKQNPACLMKGFNGSFFCMVPATAIQFGLTAELKKHVHGKTGALISPLIAGAASAIPATWQEFVLTQMKKEQYPSGFFSTARCLLEKSGWKSFMTTGLLETMARFGTGTLCYTALSPYLKETLENQHSSSGVARGLSCLIAGGITAVVTQPFDRFKWVRQHYYPKKLHLNELISQACDGRGIQGMFQASTPRLIRVTSAVSLASYMFQKIQEAQLEQDNINHTHCSPQRMS